MHRDSDTPSVALAHHWLVSMRGGEKFLLHLKSLFPDAPIYTLLARSKRLDPALVNTPIHTSWLQKLAFIPNIQRPALPVLASAARCLDAREHDVVICSDAAIVKAIRTRPDALKICYCHSPMRYVWDLYDQYYQAAGPLGRSVLRISAPRLRRQDVEAADTVHAFIANSECVADRIRRNYNRPSVVIPPPVDTDFPPPLDRPEDFYLVVGELVDYKRNDLAIQACTRTNRPLVVIGTGSQMKGLRRIAGSSVRFLGWQPDEVVRDHMRRCRALLFCGEEDFGMVPVEVQAAGRPVIAYGRGGALETVLDGKTGLFFHEPTVASLKQAILHFESSFGLLSPTEIQTAARRFVVTAFHERFQQFYRWCLNRMRTGGNEAVRREMDTIATDAFMNHTDSGGDGHA